MLITLDYKNRMPLCDQLCESIIRLGACGAIAPGEQLPSVRSLAQELGINPNTVQKAYRILESHGIIDSVPGKGSFLSSSGGAQDRMRQRGKDQLVSGLQAALECGLSAQEIIRICADYLRQKEGVAE